MFQKFKKGQNIKVIGQNIKGFSQNFQQFDQTFKEFGHKLVGFGQNFRFWLKSHILVKNSRIFVKL